MTQQICLEICCSLVNANLLQRFRLLTKSKGGVSIRCTENGLQLFRTLTARDCHSMPSTEHGFLWRQVHSRLGAREVLHVQWGLRSRGSRNRRCGIWTNKLRPVAGAQVVRDRHEPIFHEKSSDKTGTQPSSRNPSPPPSSRAKLLSTLMTKNGALPNALSERRVRSCWSSMSNAPERRPCDGCWCVCTAGSSFETTLRKIRIGMKLKSCK